MKKHCLWATKPLPHYDKSLAICPEKNLRGIAIYANAYLVSNTVFMNAIYAEYIFMLTSSFRKLQLTNCYGQTNNWVEF